MKNRSDILLSTGQLDVEPSWNNFRRRLTSLNKRASNQRSYQKSLEAIADQAEEWRLDPTPLLLATNENLARMIRSAKIEIEYRHPEALQELFWDAARLSVREFRIKCGIARKQVIVNREVVNGEVNYHLTLTEELLEKLERTTRLQFWWQRSDEAQAR